MVLAIRSNVLLSGGRYECGYKPNSYGLTWRGRESGLPLGRGGCPCAGRCPGSADGEQVARLGDRLAEAVACGTVGRDHFLEQGGGAIGRHSIKIDRTGI